ncbi:MAG TPA: 50S ribosomal protein L11 methyltransferase [Vicinamibacterales bacterium]
MPRRIPVLDLHFPGPDPAPDLLDRAALALDEAAPSAVHEMDGDAGPVWRVFFADAAATGEARARLEAELGPLGIDVRASEIEDEDWAARSQSDLTRVTIGRVTVAPPWDVPDAPDGALVIVHPSTGFGTGHHETTRLCLALLQELPMTGRRVLDLGTGSGVLALAALRLGAGEVEAVDFDPEALRNAEENMRLNGITGGLTIRQADLAADPLVPADLVVANLTGALLQREASRIADLVRPGGALIVSGILAGELDDVLAAFASRLDVAETRDEGEWRAARLTAKHTG